jgi:hypothetical protein
LLPGRVRRLLVLVSFGLTACGEDPVPTDLGARVAGLPSKAGEMTWSADGQSLFVVTSGAPTITAVPADGGKATVLLRSSSSLDQLMRAPDGRLVVRQEGRLVRVPLDRTPPEDLFVPDAGLAVTRAFFSKDGGRLAVVAASAGGANVTTSVVDPATRQVLSVRAGDAWTFSPGGDRLLFVIEERGLAVERLRAISVPVAGGEEADEGTEEIGPEERLIRVEWRGQDVFIFLAGTYVAPAAAFKNVGLRLQRLKRYWGHTIPFISDERVFEHVYYFDPRRDQLATWSWACYGAAYGSPVDHSCRKREYTLHLHYLPFPVDLPGGGGHAGSNTQLGTAAASGPVAFRADARDIAAAPHDVYILENVGY